MNKISYLYHKYYSQYLSTCILIINLYNPRNELQGLILIHVLYRESLKLLPKCWKSYSQTENSADLRLLLISRQSCNQSCYPHLECHWFSVRMKGSSFFATTIWYYNTLMVRTVSGWAVCVCHCTLILSLSEVDLPCYSSFVLTTSLSITHCNHSDY